MSDSLTIDVDDSALLAMLASFPDVVLKHVKPASKVTGDSIRREASARARRRAAGPTRGGQHMADQVVVEETHNGDGYVVFVNYPDMPGLPGWLEFGTKHMEAHPFLFSSARIEEGPHDRRVREALQNACDEVSG